MQVRLLYFTLAAAWGFLAGTAAILGGMTLLGRPLNLDPVVGLILLGAGVVALGGGLVAAAAYRDAVKRFR